MPVDFTPDSRPDPAASVLGTRWLLIAVGAVAGLAHWAVFDLLTDHVAYDRLVLGLGVAVVVFFAALMMMLGPVRPGRAMAGAGALAAVCAALMLWASLRFDHVSGFLDSGKPLVAVATLAVIAAPFIAALLRERGGWRHYQLLFDTSWESVLRYVAGGLFTGLVWGLLYLSDTFLGLVGITIIDDLIDLDPVPWLISGVALGLGLSVFYELRDYISADLFVQLLRLLTPLVLGVVVIFILALPFRGLSGLLGGLSPAVTLAGVSLAGVVLVSAAVHGGTAGEVQTPVMRLAARVLSGVIAVPAVLAVYAVAVRIGQYGLTPDRIAALVAALVVLGYGASYAVLALLGRDWMGRLRQANLALAGLVVLVSALWLTPLLNSERMSVASQLDRARAGGAVEELPLWEMARDWGRAGTAGLAELRALESHPEHARLVAQIERAEATQLEYEFRQESEEASQVSLHEIVPLRPVGVRLPEGSLDRVSIYERMSLREGCARKFSDGQPGCVLVVADFDPTVEEIEGILLWRSGHSSVQVLGLRIFPDEGSHRVSVIGSTATLEEEDIQRVLNGEFEIAPVRRKALRIGDQEFYPYN